MATLITPENYRDYVLDDKGDLQIVTASEIKAFLYCPRAWVTSRRGPKTLSTASQLLGTAVHQAIQVSIEKQSEIVRTRMPNSPVWKSTAKMLDELQPSGQCEVAMQGELEIAGLPVWGRIDNIEKACVRDWKTYSKKIPLNEALEKDPQFLIYSSWVLKQFALEYIDFLFIYLCTTDVWYEYRSFEQTDRHAFQRFTETVNAMRDWAKSKSLPQCICGKCGTPMKTKEEKAVEAVTAAVQIISEYPLDSGLELYIDCLPLKAQDTLILLDSLITDRCAEICRDRKAADIRLIEFGKGKGYLADSFRKNPPTGPVYARSRSDLAQSVIDVLIPLARRVFVYAP